MAASTADGAGIYSHLLDLQRRTESPKMGGFDGIYPGAIVTECDQPVAENQPNGRGGTPSVRGLLMVNISALPGGFPRGRPARQTDQSHFSGQPQRLAIFVGVTAALVCSSKGCRNPARYELRWNNPKLHPPQRRKVWLACEDHRDKLSGFLQVRGFLRETVPMG